jgi:membrane protein DedA with SNARE-associated domain
MDHVDHATIVQHYLQVAEPYLNHYGYGAILLLIFLESFGMPVPGESILIAAAIFAGQGKLNLAAVTATAWAAAIAGDNLGYAIGHYGGRPVVLRYGRYVGIREKHLDYAERFIARHGGWIVTVARFIEGLRQLNGIVCGTIKMRWWRFFFFNALGATLWVAVWALGAYFLGKHLEEVFDFIARYEWKMAGVGGALILVAVGFFVRRWWRRKKTGEFSKE